MEKTSNSKTQPIAHQIVGIDFARSAQAVSKAHVQRMMECGCRDCALFLGGLQAGREGARQGLVAGIEKAAKEQAKQEQQATRRVRPAQDLDYLAFDQAQRLNNFPAYIQRHALAQGAGEQYLRRAGALPTPPPNPRDKLVERAEREAVIRRAGDEAVRGLTQQPGEQVTS